MGLNMVFEGLVANLQAVIEMRSVR